MRGPGDKRGGPGVPEKIQKKRRGRKKEKVGGWVAVQGSQAQWLSGGPPFLAASLGTSTTIGGYVSTCIG